MRRVVGETIEEMKSVARRWPDDVSINWPPRSRDAYRSRSIPMLFVDVRREDEILRELESVDVPEEYITLLTMMMRERHYNEKCGGPTEDSAKFFEQEIRGKTILLLRAGAWIDEPSSLSLQNLNKRIEKCDLGRRSDLNFSSTPIGLDRVQKYDQDFKQTGEGKVEDLHENKAPDFDFMYFSGSKEEREQLLTERPWMRSSWIERYGEP
jgi:hypothetical protein